MRMMKKQRPPMLPGGVIVWKSLLIASMVFWVLVFWYMGPLKPDLVTDYQDVNNKLEAMLPVFTHKAKARIPHSSGDCIARWKQKNPGLDYVDDSAAHQDCKGEHPITKISKQPVNVTARWIEGI